VDKTTKDYEKILRWGKETKAELWRYFDGFFGERCTYLFGFFSLFFVPFAFFSFVSLYFRVLRNRLMHEQLFNEYGIYVSQNWLLSSEKAFPPVCDYAIGFGMVPVFPFFY
jgi:hypothetical protein